MKIDIPKNVVEKIRCTATSPEHLVQMIKEAFIKYTDYTISFSSYPYKYNISVSNSHNAPKGYEKNWCRDKSKPKGYPGWSGTWKGIIKYKSNSTNTPTISDLKNVMPFIKTGSGSSGSDFTIEGILFLYDFPAMHELYKNTKNLDKDLVEKEYSELVNRYSAEYISKRRNEVESNETYQTIVSINRELKELRETSSNMCATISSTLKNEFNQKHRISLPLPPFPTTQSDRLRVLHEDLCYEGAIVHPDLEGIVKDMVKIKEKFNKFVEENPELVI